MTYQATAADMPAPDLEHRDGVGRLIAATWLGARSLSPRWLVAIDGSSYSRHAVEAVVRLAAAGRESGVDLVHVQPWLSKEAAQAGLASRGWSATAQARHLLDAAALPWQLHVVMGEAASEIVALAERLGSIGIAMGWRGLNPAESVLLGSVAFKVLQLAKVPVLVVR